MLSKIQTFEDFEKHKSEIAIDLVNAVIRQNQLPKAELIPFSEGTNIVFCYGNKVIKIFPPCHQSQFESDRLVMTHLDGKISVKTPRLETVGDISGWPYLIMTKLEGTLLETLWQTMSHANKLIIIGELGALIREVHALPVNGLEAIDCHWPIFLKNQISNCVDNHRQKGLSEKLIQQLPSFISEVGKELLVSEKTVLLTGEYTPMNFLVEKTNDVWHISGLIDFGDAMLGLPQYDLLGPAAFLIQGDKALLKTFLLAYGYSESEFTKKFSHQMTALMLLHQYSNLNIQIRISGWQDKVSSLLELQELVWGL